MAMLLQASGQPPGMSEVEAERLKAIQAGDMEAAAHAELGILTALLSAQFGPARVDPDQVRNKGYGWVRRWVSGCVGGWMGAALGNGAG